MKSSAGNSELVRLRKLAAIGPRTHVLWCWDEGMDEVEARKRAMIESGKAGKNDRFVLCGWYREAGDEGP